MYNKIKSYINKIYPGLIFSLVFVIAIISYSANAQHDHSKHTEKKAEVQKTESIVREGKIDLKKIDKNKDGKVFQDPMDWNVISDEPGNCPICKMKLVEVTLKEAKVNLKKNGFKVR